MSKPAIDTKDPYKVILTVLLLIVFSYYLFWRIVRLFDAGFYIEGVIEAIFLFTSSTGCGGVIWEFITYQLSQRK